MSLQKQYNVKASNTEMFAESIFRIGTYEDVFCSLEVVDLTPSVGLDVFGSVNSQPQQKRFLSMA